MEKEKQQVVIYGNFNINKPYYVLKIKRGRGVRMSKICGYSCEHNKSGVCQISVCDKRTIMSDKTEAQMFTRYIDTTITKLQQENKQLKSIIYELREHMLDIDYKMGWQYAEYLNKLLEEKEK